MKLKGWKKLGKTLDKEVKKIDKEITIILSSKDECMASAKRVYFSILRISAVDKLFMKHLYTEYPDAPNLSAYLYALLHEIGHIKTIEILQNEEKGVREKAKESNETYFRLPSEIAATEWAVNYVQEKNAEARVMGYKVEKAMVKFLEKNITR